MSDARRSASARRSRSRRTFAATRFDASLISVGWSMPAIATLAAPSAASPEGVIGTASACEPLRGADSGVAAAF